MEIKVEGVMEVRPVKERKKHDRFNGMSEEEVSRRTLPDHLADNLDIIIVSTIASYALCTVYTLYTTYTLYTPLHYVQYLHYLIIHLLYPFFFSNLGVSIDTVITVDLVEWTTFFLAD